MIQQDVARLIADGWACLPIPAGRKAPAIKDWETKTFTPEDFTEGDNIGVRCGPPSGNRVDVDIDAAIAVAIAQRLLPQTGLVHGRPGKPCSHHWYTCTKAKSLQFKDLSGAVLLEIRGQENQQTVIPPSVHPSGDVLRWESDKSPCSVEYNDLLSSVQWVAIASLFAQHWPSGSRHALSGHIGGFLARLDIAPLVVEQIVRAIVHAVGEGQWADDNARYARESAEKHLAGDKTTGLPSLTEALPKGGEIAKRIFAWLGREGENEVEGLNKSHFVVSVGKDVVVATEEDHGLVFQSFEMFTKRYYNRRVGKTRLGEFWLSHPSCRTYRRVVFAPPPQAVDPRDFNLWRGFSVTPDPNPEPALRCPLLLSHLHEVICDGNTDHARYLLDLLAVTVQKPGMPVGVAAVLRGPQGTGKSMFVKALGRLFGRHFIHLDKQKHITGAFNQHLSGKVLVFADEAVWAGDRRDVGALKRLVTEDTLSIERKGLDVVEERSSVHLWMATNEDWVWPAGFQDRRGFILDVNYAIRPQSYYDALLEEIDGPGLPALLSFLLQREITDNSWRKMPRTDALLEQQEYSMDPEAAYWKDRLYEGTLASYDTWPEIISTSELYTDFVSRTGVRGGGIGRRTMQVPFTRKIQKFFPPLMRKAVRAMAPVEVGMFGEPRFERRQTLCFKLPSLAAARKYFDTVSGIKSAWSRYEEPGQEPLLDPRIKALTQDDDVI